jgi:phage major head subunit gpT-like protein
MDINLFTTMMRSEFLKSMQAVPKKEPRWKEFTTVVPSTARTENYAWMTPSPGISRYVGHRRYAQLDQIKYTVPNLEFDGSISVSLRDVEDDQIGGYPLRFQELGQKANAFPGRWVMQTLNNGASTTCFDGSSFFATSHNQGTGNSTLPTNFGGGVNALTYTAQGSSDATTHKAVFMIHDGAIKPLGYQNRKAPALGTNSGETRSREAKQVNYWCDLEGNAFFGYWWDAIQVTITNTPNLTDIFTVIDVVIRQFYGFTLPASLPTDPSLYVHQDKEFTSEIATVACSLGIARLLTHAVTEDRIGVSVSGSTAGFTSNIFKGSFAVQPSGYLGT